MDNEEATVHDFATLLEDIDSEIDEKVHHLVIDAFITNSYQAWLQRAAQVVQEDLALLIVQLAAGAIELVQLNSDLLVDALKKGVELMLQV